MAKKILITCTDSMMKQFLEPHVLNLVENGYTVDVVCSEVLNRMAEVRNDIGGRVRNLFQVHLRRNPLSLSNYKGYKELKGILAGEHYDIIWTNEPVMGVMTRFAAKKTRKTGTKVLYMAHGFHFYKGCPALNKLASPIEKFMARYHDALVLINWEDYYWAQKKLKTKMIFHIDGIGVDFERKVITKDRETVRNELGVTDQEKMILSVGELQKRKNHEPMIRAIAKLNRQDIKYYICGIGYLEEHLKQLVCTLNLENQVFFLGYRRDVADIMNAADIFAHPSLREGLGIAPLEAMALELPLVASNIQGIPDYVEDGVTGFMCGPMDVDGYKENLAKLLDDEKLRMEMGARNKECAQKYTIEKSKDAVLAIIREVEGA